MRDSSPPFLPTTIPLNHTPVCPSDCQRHRHGRVKPHPFRFSIPGNVRHLAPHDISPRICPLKALPSQQSRATLTETLPIFYEFGLFLSNLLLHVRMVYI